MHTSEEEQLETIKRWWQENGVAVVVGLVVGVGGLFGWQAWQSHLDTRAENASVRYTELMSVLDQDGSEDVQSLVDDILDEYSPTPYAPLSALAGARAAANAEESEAAAERLQWVIDNAKQSEFVPLARLRLARLHLAGGQLEAAETLLDAGDYPDSYTARRAELRGDLHSARGEASAARAAYERALNAELPVQNRQMVQIKRDALGPADPAPAAGGEPADA